MMPDLRTAVAACALALAAVGPAVAHSQKQMTVPADGAVLNAPPDQVRMMFDMPILITMFVLTDADGTEYPAERGDAMQQVKEFTATPPALPAGQYDIEWRGLSSDGHPVQGTFSFAVE